MLEQCGGTVEQLWWNSVVEQWNSHGGTVEHWWWNSVMKQWNSNGETVKGGHSGTVRWNSVMEQWNSHGGTLWWNSGTLTVEQCGRTVEQSWWNSVVEQWNSRTVMVEQ